MGRSLGRKVDQEKRKARGRDEEENNNIGQKRRRSEEPKRITKARGKDEG